MDAERTSPQCAVCAKTMKYGVKCFLLPCLHSVCESCLNSTAESLACSRCHETFQKSENIILQDHMTESQMFYRTVKERPWEILCTKIPHNLPAMTWCMGCASFFCKSCQKAHSQVKISTGHRTTLIKNMTHLPRSLAPKCPIHPSSVLEMYDSTCEITICSECASEEHPGCATSDLSSAGNEEREVLEKSQKNLQHHLQDIRILQEDLQQKDVTLKQHHEANQKKVATYFETLRSLLTQKENETMEHLQRDQNTAQVEVDEQGRRLEVARRKMQHVHDYSEQLLKQSDVSDFLKLKSCVQQRISDILKDEAEQVHFTLVDISCPDNTVDGFRKLMDTFGEIRKVEYKGKDTNGDDVAENIMKNNDEKHIQDLSQKGDRCLNDDIAHVYENASIC